MYQRYTSLSVFALHLLIPVLAHASNCLYFAAVYTFAPFTSVANLQYSALQYIFDTMSTFLVPFRVHTFYLAFFVCHHFEFLFQLFWNLHNIGCQLNATDKWIKPMLACKFHFIFYFYLPLKLCNFNYSNLSLLINNSFDITHCITNLNGNCYLKLTIYIKAKCLYELIFLYSIGYLDHGAFPLHFCWGVDLTTKFSKDRISIFRGDYWERVKGLFQGASSFYIKK